MLITLASFSFPSFYLEPFQVESGIYPKDYLKRADAGLKFLIAKAPSANRKHLIGNLLSGVPVAAEFEVMLSWALSNHFGEQAVDPYPRVDPDDKKTVDFAVVRDGKRLLIEATTLLDDRASGQEKQYCVEHGIPGTVAFRSQEKDAIRLLRACLQKIHQRRVSEPLFLCVNQCASWPDPATGAEVVGRVLAQEIWARDSTFVGMGYFYAGHLVATGFAEARACAISANMKLLSDLRTSLCLLADSSTNP